MPTFPGTKDAAVIQGATDPYTTANLFTARDYYTGDVLPANALTGDVFGSLTSTPYPAPYSTTHAAGLSQDFIQDWYYRIHLIPTVMDLGNLVSSQTRTLTLWNAFFVVKPFTAIA